MAYARINTEVEVDLSDFDTDDLIDELKFRNVTTEIAQDTQSKIIELFQLRRTNDARFDEAFSEYVYETIGRIS